jgi:hypothetical protein
MSVLAAVIVVALIAVLVGAWLRLRSSPCAGAGQPAMRSSSEGQIEPRPGFPSSGLLVPEGVLRSAGSTSVAIWDALEVVAVPVAVEYYPVTEAEIAKFRASP